MSSYAKRQQAYREQKNSGAMEGDESAKGTLYFLMFVFGPPAGLALLQCYLY
eukprot:COSAG04_NODE_5780_length_1494_cov_4.494624_2_plen_52_part_00